MGRNIRNLEMELKKKKLGEYFLAFTRQESIHNYLSIYEFNIYRYNSIDIHTHTHAVLSIYPSRLPFSLSIYPSDAQSVLATCCTCVILVLKGLSRGGG